MSGSWNEPEANPRADINDLLESLRGAQEGVMPATLAIDPRAYVELVMPIRFGWWPMSFFRRRAERRRLLAEHALKPNRWWQ